MRSIVKAMLIAQRTLLRVPDSSPERLSLVANLRQQVPEPVLAHYLRRVEQGTKGVAEVHHNVCSGCHMKVPSSVAAALRKPHDLLLCENCGAYLYLPDDELAQLLPSKPVATSVRRRRSAEAAPASAA